VSPLFGPLALLAATVAGAVVLALLRRVGDWTRRRALQLAVLAAPLPGLALGIAAVHHATGRLCPIGAPPWDYRLDTVVVLLMELGAIGGLATGLARLLLLCAMLARRGFAAPDAVQARANALADRLGVRRPRVRVCPRNSPLALTWGLCRPTVLLSTWMLARLDAEELDAVIAHELGHVLRRDFLIVALATVLRDAFCYLPTSRAAYRRLQAEKEPACDELAVQSTLRPLALASALARVWEYAVIGAAVEPIPSLTDRRAPVEERIERLMHWSPPPVAEESRRGGMFAPGFGLSAGAALTLLTFSGAAALLSPMSCGAMSPLSRLF